MFMKCWIKKSFVLGMSLAMLAPQLSYGFGESDVIQNSLTRDTGVNFFKPGWANFFIHKDTLRSFYEQRAYQAVWIGADGKPNAMAHALKAALKNAGTQGLNPDDYWDSSLEQMYTAKKIEQAWITFELAASEALVRYATHLSTGRFDPTEIDTDIKFTRKKFTDYAELNAAVTGGASVLASALERFAPSHPRYVDMKQLLVYFKDIQSKGGWGVLQAPSKRVQRGVTDPIVGKLRARLNQLGYRVSSAGGDQFDEEMDQVIRQFQTVNNMSVDGIVGNEVLKFLNKSVAERITQLEVNMEKLRWLPKNLESRHIFVNLATTEFNFFDEGQKVFHFRTINGQVFRRTPSMRDVLNYVELNPTWTVPRSIAVNDKLSLIRQDPGYLAKNNMKLMDPRVGSSQDESGDGVVDPYSVDWSKVTKHNFPYYIRQEPGYNNALGVIKFPLTNIWAIYLHYTNDAHLFGESKRHLSSGCVRLEKPFEFAAYILRDNVQTRGLKFGNTTDSYWPLDKITSMVPLAPDQRPNPDHLQRRIELKKSIPVYMLYLTVDRDEKGAIRFVDDVYGQDIRVGKTMRSIKNGEELF